MNQKISKEQTLAILAGMADNIMYLHDTIDRDGEYGFDLDVLTSFMDHKFDPLLDYLAKVPDYILPFNEDSTIQ